MVASTITLPNIRKFFTPDPGMVLVEGDLKGADAYAVAWYADDAALKAKLAECERTAVKLHTLNARSMWGDPVTPDRYHKAKQGVHAVDYGCKKRTLSQHLESTEADAEDFINRWFRAHPNIRRWHEKTDAKLRMEHCVENIWGFKRHYLGRVDGLLPEALAWIGQSNTAITINKALVRLKRIPQVQPLLQVHDSVLMQIPAAEKDRLIPLIREAMLVPIPFADPLVIPIDLKWSEISWGEMQDAA